MKVNILAVLSIGLSYCLIHADGLTNQTTNIFFNVGGYSAALETNGNFKLTNPGEFWRGVWSEDTNGWRVRLEFINALERILIVDWGSAVKNSGGGYLRAPNGKFVKFELLDAKGVVVLPKPGAGTNLLGGVFVDVIYPTNLPTWAQPSEGSLEANFPKTISTSVYPYTLGNFRGDSIAGYIWAHKDFPPEHLNVIHFSDLYSITNEGYYTLTIQPVIYKQFNHADSAILDRVDLPSVTTKVHLKGVSR